MPPGCNPSANFSKIYTRTCSSPNRKSVKSRASNWSGSSASRARRISVSARGRSCCAVFRCGVCRKTNCCTSAATAISFLQVTGHPKFGVPFGQDRLVPIFLATLAVRQKTQVIRFQSAAEMLDSFGMHKGGKEYRRLVAAFERIFGATIFFGTDTLTGPAKVVQRSRFNFMSEAKIWYSRTPDQIDRVQECNRAQRRLLQRGPRPPGAE